jgi:hypothetical protein
VGIVTAIAFDVTNDPADFKIWIFGIYNNTAIVDHCEPIANHEIASHHGSGDKVFPACADNHGTSTLFDL